MQPTLAAKKIRSMEIRGALKIAVTALDSLAEFISNSKETDKKRFLAGLRKAGKILKDARPTAVSLPNAVDYVLFLAENTDDRVELVRKIKEYKNEQRRAIDRIGQIGSRRIEDGDTILTHCNSKTALAVLLEAAKTKDIHVVCTETRPRNQGYITARELAKAGVPVTLIIDSAVRRTMKELEVDKVIVGADTVYSNGSIINKIGTSQVALVAQESKVPVLCACETLKFAPQTLMGELIEIEERDVGEIRKPMKGVKMLNPAFDVTPPGYIDVIVTEDGIIPPYMAYQILRDKFGWELGKMMKP